MPTCRILWECSHKAARRIVMYLYATKTFGLTYHRGDCRPEAYGQDRHPLGNAQNHLVTFADSDYAMDSTRRSTMGTVICMNGSPISWASVLGKTVCTSTCKSEIAAAVAACKDAIHLRSMLREVGIDHGPIVLHEDK